MRRRIAVVLMAMLVATGGLAQTGLDYEAAVQNALAQRGCSFDGDGRDGRLAFARQMSLHIGIPATALMDRDGVHYPRLTRAVADLADRGIIRVEGTTMTLEDCGD